MPLRLPLGGISNSRCSLQRSMLFWCTVTLIRLERVLHFESLEVPRYWLLLGLQLLLQLLQQDCRDNCSVMY